MGDETIKITNPTVPDGAIKSPLIVWDDAAPFGGFKLNPDYPKPSPKAIITIDRKVFPTLQLYLPWHRRVAIAWGLVWRGKAHIKEMA